MPVFFMENKTGKSGLLKRAEDMPICSHKHALDTRLIRTDPAGAEFVENTYQVYCTICPYAEKPYSKIE